ncbi:polymerase [Ralstonia sp. A12]|uniref:O-antigen ligase family protein n=1 Tax=Ralstonia sp. A12 TaxID=1217052 RepID=UPI000575A5C3|nr:O-antigen ligase family protein [Ralstonia sp. A12]KHK56268.1 polymerase [Ralstonia sp. A12]
MNTMVQRGRAVVSCVPVVLAVLGIFVLPALMLSMHNAAFLAFLLLLVSALWSMLAGYSELKDRLLAMWREHCWLILAMAAMPTAMLVSALLNQAASVHIPFAYGRLWLFGFVLFALLQLPSRQLQQVQWGSIVGALGSMVWAYLDLRIGRSDHVAAFANPIPFGNLSLLLGLFSLISIGWSWSGGKALIALRVLAGIGGVYASYLSQARGGWVAIPVLFCIAVATLRDVSRWKRMGVLVGLLILLTAIAASSGMVRDRLEQAMQDVDAYRAGQVDTSMGIRFQLWKASASMLAQHPIAGVGPGQFKSNLEARYRKGEITERAASVEHAHNEFLYNGATLGVLGIGALLALYLVPAAYFLRAALCDDRVLRTTGAMGLTLCVGFILFGLTEVMLIIAQTVVFYSVMVAVFTAHIHRRRQELGANPVL